MHKKLMKNEIKTFRYNPDYEDYVNKNLEYSTLSKIAMKHKKEVIK